MYAMRNAWIQISNSMHRQYQYIKKLHISYIYIMYICMTVKICIYIYYKKNIRYLDLKHENYATYATDCNSILPPKCKGCLEQLRAQDAMLDGMEEHREMWLLLNIRHEALRALGFGDCPFFSDLPLSGDLTDCACSKDLTDWPKAWILFFIRTCPEHFGPGSGVPLHALVWLARKLDQLSWTNVDGRLHQCPSLLLQQRHFDVTVLPCKFEVLAFVQKLPFHTFQKRSDLLLGPRTDQGLTFTIVWLVSGLAVLLDWWNRFLRGLHSIQNTFPPTRFTIQVHLLVRGPWFGLPVVHRDWRRFWCIWSRDWHIWHRAWCRDWCRDSCWFHPDWNTNFWPERFQVGSGDQCSH